MRLVTVLGRWLTAGVLALAAGLAPLALAEQSRATIPGGLTRQAALSPRASSRAPEDDARVRLRQAFGRLPLTFEANHGQTDPHVQFLARGPGYTLFLA